MPKLTQSLIAIYGIDEIKALIVADLKSRGFTISPDDVQEPWQFSDLVQSEGKCAPFAGYEIRKDLPIAETVKKPTYRAIGSLD